MGRPKATFVGCSLTQYTPTTLLTLREEEMLRLRGLRVPMHPVAAADVARPSRRSILKTVAALFRQGADAVLYGFLAVCWAHSLCGFAVQILARWVYGEGSAAEAIGTTVRASYCFLMVRLFLPISPLILMRAKEHAEFIKEKERREELASNEQLPKRNGALHMLPEGFNLAPFCICSPLCQLLCTASMMKHADGEGSLMWRRMGSVLLDVGYFVLAVTNGFLFQNLVILVTVPRVAKDEYDVMP